MSQDRMTPLQQRALALLAAGVPLTHRPGADEFSYPEVHVGEMTLTRATFERFKRRGYLTIHHVEGTTTTYTISPAGLTAHRAATPAQAPQP